MNNINSQPPAPGKLAAYCGGMTNLVEQSHALLKAAEAHSHEQQLAVQRLKKVVAELAELQAPVAALRARLAGL